jgi:putative GTP pyrophosphokinase
MDNWASLEHKMRYKKNLSQIQLEELSDELLKCAKMSEILDIKMQAIHSEIMKSEAP